MDIDTNTDTDTDININKNQQTGSDLPKESSKNSECSVSSNTFLDYESLSDEELICRYIMEKKNKGQFLSYDHHLMIKNWVNKIKSVDDLLMILDDIFSSMKHPSRFSMLSLNKRVLTKIQTVSKF